MTALRTILSLASVVVLAETSPDTLLYAQTPPASPTTSLGGQTELGMKAGVGLYSYDEILDPGTRGVTSIEACLLCGRRALTVEYSHWTKPRGGSAGARAYRSADTVAAGLRLQGQDRVRPFFDVGMAIGNARWGRSDLTTIGAVVGTGVTVHPADHFYVRFGARLMKMSHYHYGAEVGAGAGWRFGAPTVARAKQAGPPPTGKAAATPRAYVALGGSDMAFTYHDHSENRWEGQVPTVNLSVGYFVTPIVSVEAEVSRPGAMPAHRQMVTPGYSSPSHLRLAPNDPLLREGYTDYDPTSALGVVLTVAGHSALAPRFALVLRGGGGYWRMSQSISRVRVNVLDSGGSFTLEAPRTSNMTNTWVLFVADAGVDITLSRRLALVPDIRFAAGLPVRRDQPVTFIRPGVRLQYAF